MGFQKPDLPTPLSLEEKEKIATETSEKETDTEPEDATKKTAVIEDNIEVTISIRIRNV